jgi:hypothetical protein
MNAVKKPENILARKKLFHAAALLLLTTLVFVSRLPSINEPLERDITGYAVIGHELVNGKNLYTDIWDHKPPGVYVVYAFAESLFGYNQTTIYILGALVSTLTLLGIFFCVYRFNGNTYFGLGAAMLWLLMSIDIKMQANQPNVEVFLNMLLAWVLFIAFNLKNRPLSIWEYLSLGVLFFVASFFKTVIAFIALPLWLAIISIEIKHYNCTYVDVFRKSAALVTIGILGWAGISTYYLVVGRFGDFYGAVFTFNQFYAGSMITNFLEGLKPQLFFPKYIIQYIPLYLIIVISACLSIIKRVDLPITILITAWFVGTFFAVSAPGFYFPHYYQLWIPVLIIGSATGLDVIKQQISIQHNKTYHTITATIFIYLCFITLFMFNLNPNEWSEKKYGVTFIESKQVADKVGELLTNDESLFEWGAETGLYFYTQKRPVTKIIFISHFGLNNYFSRELSQQTFDNLKNNPPELFIVNIGYLPYDNINNTRILGGDPILEWFKQNYDIYEGLFSEQRYVGGALKNSNLSKRLSLQLNRG